MRFDWPPIWQGSPLQLVSQVQETNWPRHRQDANAETFGKKDKERIQRGMQALSFQQEEEQVSLNVVASADRTNQQMRQHARVQRRRERKWMSRLSVVDFCSFSVRTRDCRSRLLQHSYRNTSVYEVGCCRSPRDRRLAAKYVRSA